MPASNALSTGFDANWSGASGATGYRLEVSRSSSFTVLLAGYQSLDTGTLSHWRVGGLRPGTVYYYRVRAYDSAGSGPASAAMMVTTAAPAWTFTTPAGYPGAEGATNGTGSAARFHSPRGVAPENGDLFVADSINKSVRKPAGAVVSTIANGFTAPRGLAADGSGSLYVSDYTDMVVYKVTTGGAVSVFAGAIGLSGSADGIGSAARFTRPRGVAVDAAHNVYVTDGYTFSTIRRITPDGNVTTIAGSTVQGSDGSTDGPVAIARFNSPDGIAVDAGGVLFIADTSNRTIRKLTPAGIVSTVAGVALSQGTTDGTGAAARFTLPEGVAVDAQGNLFVTDYTRVRRITPEAVVTTIGGSTGCQHADGEGAAARFCAPYGIAVDAAGNLHLADAQDDTIRKGTPPVAPIVPDLDVDASAAPTRYDALTDGMLVYRYLSGLTGTSLTGHATGATATRTDPLVVAARLDDLWDSLDIDGNGTPDAMTDGLLLVRYLLGLRGQALIAGAVAPDAVRSTAAAIELHIQSLLP